MKTTSYYKLTECPALLPAEIYSVRDFCSGYKSVLFPWAGHATGKYCENILLGNIVKTFPLQKSHALIGVFISKAGRCLWTTLLGGGILFIILFCGDDSGFKVLVWSFLLLCCCCWVFCCCYFVFGFVFVCLFSFFFWGGGNSVLLTSLFIYLSWVFPRRCCRVLSRKTYSNICLIYFCSAFFSPYVNSQKPTTWRILTAFHRGRCFRKIIFRQQLFLKFRMVGLFTISTAVFLNCLKFIYIHVNTQTQRLNTGMSVDCCCSVIIDKRQRYFMSMKVLWPSIVR